MLCHSMDSHRRPKMKIIKTTYGKTESSNKLTLAILFGNIALAVANIIVCVVL